MALGVGLYIIVPGNYAQVVTKQKSPVIIIAAGSINNSGSHYIIPLRQDVTSLIVEIIPFHKATAHYNDLSTLIGGNQGSGGVGILPFQFKRSYQLVHGQSSTKITDLWKLHSCLGATYSP